MIPAEAVEAAAEAVDAADRRPLGPTEKWAEVIARAALEAAAPYMLAGAWDEGAAAGAINELADCRGEEPEITNPYRTAK